MIKILVTSATVRNMKGVGKTSGRPYDMNFQTAYAYVVNQETGEVSEIPDKFEFTLQTGQAPYPRGSYTLSPSACYVSRDGHLELVPRLVPVPAAK